MGSVRILPCPFCGSLEVRVSETTDSHFFVSCDRCEASGSLTTCVADAVWVWNVAARLRPDCRSGDCRAATYDIEGAETCPSCAETGESGRNRDIERNAAGVRCVALEGEIKHLRRSLNMAYEISDSYRDECAALKRSHEQVLRVWDATAEHLRKERGKRRYAEEDARFLRSCLRRWEDRFLSDEGQTPIHYAGDGVVTAAQALRAATSQPTKTERTEGGFYWWALAFKYVWRLWSKGQAERDAEKAIDCLKRVIGEIDHE